MPKMGKSHVFIRFTTPSKSLPVGRVNYSGSRATDDQRVKSRFHAVAQMDVTVWDNFTFAELPKGFN